MAIRRVSFLDKCHHMFKCFFIQSNMVQSDTISPHFCNPEGPSRLNFHLKLELLRALSELSAHERAAPVYESLQVKNIQCDTVSHAMWIVRQTLMYHSLGLSAVLMRHSYLPRALFIIRSHRHVAEGTQMLQNMRQKPFVFTRIMPVMLATASFLLSGKEILCRLESFLDLRDGCVGASKWPQRTQS